MEGLNGVWRRHAKDDYYLPNDPQEKGPKYIEPTGRKLGKINATTKLWLHQTFVKLRDTWPCVNYQKNELEMYKLALVTPYAFYHSLMRPYISDQSRMEANARAEGRQKKVSATAHSTQSPPDSAPQSQPAKDIVRYNNN